MTLAERIYRLFHARAMKRGEKVPYYYQYSLGTIIAKPIRKWFSAVVIPTLPFNGMRIVGYRLCGYKIGKDVFIGMRCYLDDMCYDKIVIGDHVTVSYGVYFACHGRKQGHNLLIIRDGAYIGMKAAIVAREDMEIGEKAVVGACTLVNRSIPANATAVGIPCRILKDKQ